MATLNEHSHIRATYMLSKSCLTQDETGREIKVNYLLEKNALLVIVIGPKVTEPIMRRYFVFSDHRFIPEQIKDFPVADKKSGDLKMGKKNEFSLSIILAHFDNVEVDSNADLSHTRSGISQLCCHHHS